MSDQRYTVLEHIDAGGMAEVFKANSSSVKGFEKLVAIKRILPSLTKNERFVRMFLDEAKVSLFLNHTNCVQVFDLVYAEKTYLIIMEFVNGVNLKRLIEAIPHLPVEAVVYIAIEICKGLAHAHNKTDASGAPLGIVHRDVSPANIMVSVEGEVKVTDFGLAKARDQLEKTDPGVVKGKFGYLSPESAFGKEVDKRTDIFAVGILIWEMLTGERLFLGETDLETLKQVRKNKERPTSQFRRDVPPQLEEILRKTLATDPDARYQTAESLMADLTTFLFAYGKPVSSIDIAKLVADYKSKTGPSVKTTEDRVLEQELQEAVNNLVSLEKILSESNDLDQYMARVYGSMESTSKSGISGSSGDVNFEDPSLWADLGLDEGVFGSKAFSTEVGAPGPKGNAWQQRPLNRLTATATHERNRMSMTGGRPAVQDEVTTGASRRDVTAQGPVPAQALAPGHPHSQPPTDQVPRPTTTTADYGRQGINSSHHPRPATNAVQTATHPRDEVTASTERVRTTGSTLPTHIPPKDPQNLGHVGGVTPASLSAKRQAEMLQRQAEKAKRDRVILISLVSIIIVLAALLGLILYLS